MQIYFDGGAAPNPGLCHCAIVVDGEVMEATDLGYGTNNIAEWTALLWALETAYSRKATDVEIIGDSMLVVMQANGFWKIKKKEFIPFKLEADRLRKLFKTCVIKQVGRDLNIAGHQIEATLKARPKKKP